MGGKAFNHRWHEGVAERMTLGELKNLQSYVAGSLHEAGAKSVCFPKSLGDKTSFGDLDVLVDKKGLDFNDLTRTLWSRGLRVLDTLKNGPVLSYLLEYDTKKVQVDFVSCPSEKMAFAKFYFSGNDRGNLLGRVADGVGLKFGWDGLYFKYYDPNGNQTNEYLLTQDPYEALVMLGYDADTFLAESLKSLQTMFRCVSETKYFKAHKFRFENRNHQDRMRDSKRPTYNAFLEWLEDPANRVKEVESFWNGAFMYQYLLRRNPHFHQWHENLDKQFYLREAVKAKFNGDLVAEWTGLSGQELGAVMKFVRSNLSLEAMNDMSEEELKNFVLMNTEEVNQ